MGAPVQGQVVIVANTPSVNVANSASSPVPTEITNTPSVNVANTPSVNVANSASSPVPTEITNTPSVNVANTPNVNVNQLTPSAVGTGAGVSASANTNILSSNYTPPAVGKIRVTFASSASGTLSIVIVSGSSSYVFALNSGNALNANAIYAFEIPVSSSYSYNIQYSVSATVFYQIDFVPS